METPEVAVQTANLTRRFGQFTAVDNVDLAVYKGEIFGFLGANGAGKTTLIRMLCGLLTPTEGECWVNGLDVRRKTEAVKRQIGYMSQRFSLYNDLTVAENIAFYSGVYGLTAEEITQRRDELVESVGLAPYLNSLTADLPLGMKQRLALGCALLHDPPILFLDEPTSGVDPAARRTFWQLLYKTVERGKTVFVTTHYMDEAEYCHRLAIMNSGKIIALGAPSELKEKYGQSSMQEVFISLVGTVI